ncbi:MAG: pseudouridine synthase [Hyphomicrobiaceae bacterium]
MSPGGDVHAIEVGEGDTGGRLDAVLSRALPGLSRSRVQGLIRDGAVTRDGKTIGEAGLRVKPGERYEVAMPEPVAAVPAAEPIPLAVVHEDAHLIVIDKPAGLVVHPAAGHGDGTLVNALLHHCGDSLSGIGGVRRPGIVHRLDKETSGLLVVAKTDAAHRGLSEQFAAHGRDGRLHRAYLGICWRVPEKRIGTVDAPLARSSANRTKISVSKAETAREAITHYEVLEVLGEGAASTRVRPSVVAAKRTVERTHGRSRVARSEAVAALIRLQLETGRTHQIRVHMSHIGHPLLGDPVYGTGFKASAAKLPDAATAALDALGRQALHAAELGFVHPVTGKALAFESPLPADLARLLGALRN